MLQPASRVLLLLQPLYLAWFVTGALHHQTGRMALASGSYVVSIGLGVSLSMLGFSATLNQQERVGFALDRRIALLTARVPTLDHLESPRYLDELQILRDQQGALGMVFFTLVNALSQLVYVGGTLALAVGADWRLLLVAAVGVPVAASSRWPLKWQRQAEDSSAEAGRLAQHVLGLGTSAASGAELRVFGLAQTLRERLGTSVQAWRGPLVRASRRTTAVDAGTNALFFGVAGGVLAWMVGDALTGSVGVGSLTVALMVIRQLQGAGQMVNQGIQGIGRVVRTTSRYFYLVDYTEEVRWAHPGKGEPPSQLSSGIRLDRLTYSYPDSQTPALDDISLNLPAGTVVALVGENGAGKSTLVKLLVGLYRPSGGRIVVDGSDLATFDLDVWRARLSGAFQDHARLELLARETVGVGDIPRVDNEDAVREALRAGAAEKVLASLPSGLATQLGSGWPGGVDLSGGQWQRLAIARGMMREVPLLLVLDEPTAALDPATEHALFERYAAAAQTAKRHGSVTLLVTHRFSTVSSADLVVVLDHGRIEEMGTHAALMARHGRYAELYELQARGYR